MIKKRPIAFLLPLFLAACATSPALVRGGGDKTHLGLINEESSQVELFHPDIGGIAPEGYDGQKETRIAEFCGVELEPEVEVAVPMVIALLVEPAVRLFVGRVEGRIKEAIEAYSATYQAGNSTDRFYAQLEPRPTLAWRCFRFTRVVTPNSEGDAVSPKDVALDFIGHMALAADGGAIVLRPLRLYYARPKVQKGDRLGLAISLRAGASWLQGNVGKSEEVFNQVLLNERWVTDTPKVKYYLDQPSTTYPFVRLLPWSTGSASGPGGNVTLTVAAAEVGDAPKYLEQFAEVFGEKKGDITTLLNAALMSALGFQQ